MGSGIKGDGSGISARHITQSTYATSIGLVVLDK
jgi:hypothetical protein